jgi:ankyrin repeat protein
LILAAQNGHDLCARALIEANANLEAQQNQGFTSLMLAAQNGHE